jgi:lipopolysaccharide/colanic/teichoic acid biosynthesis glycosyltransferase
METKSTKKNNEKLTVTKFESDFIPKVKHKSWLYFCGKRAFDIFFSFIALIFFFPLLIVLSIVVKCTSRGSFIFGDKRVGKNNKDIKVFKFRTMYMDAEKRLKDFLTEEQYQKWLVERKIDKDPRITRVGRFLRKTSLDELPQLINIFIGNMSFIGPRPITRKELSEHYNKEQQKILLSATPGLTGYWQVFGRSNIEYFNGNRQIYELTYFTYRGFFYDIGLIFMTIPAVFKSKGAK